MLTTLFESKKKRKRSKAGLTASVVIHGALIAAAIGASTHAATTALEKPKAENIEYVAPPPPKPPEEKKVYVAPKEAPKPAVKKPAPKPQAPRMRAPTPPAPKPVAAAPAPAPANVPVLNVPVAVPTTIPGPDLNAIPTVSDVVARASDAAGSGTPATSGAGDGKGKTTESAGGDVSVSRDDGSAWGEEQVDVAVRQQGAANLRYPDRLRSANITGTVVMRFIVGANGRVESGSIQVIDSPHEEFTDAVKDALRSMRFRPAEVRGTKVRQLVEQSFTFKLNK